MKSFFYLIALFVVLGFLACNDAEEQDRGQQAAIAAKGYYDLLLEQKYDSFVIGYNRVGQLPQQYQQQLLLNAQMFVEQQKNEHHGMAKVEILNAKADTLRHVAEVFLQMVYGDSTKEQILVPMVQTNSVWKMR